MSPRYGPAPAKRQRGRPAATRSFKAATACAKSDSSVPTTPRSSAASTTGQRLYESRHGSGEVAVDYVAHGGEFKR